MALDSNMDKTRTVYLPVETASCHLAPGGKRLVHGPETATGDR